MPLYSIQTETTNPTQTIASFPVYQGFTGPATVNGVQLGFYTHSSSFFSSFSGISQNLQVTTGNGTNGPYNIQVPIIGPTAPPNPPFNTILRGHIDLTGIISTGVNEDPPLISAISAVTQIPLMPTTSVMSSVFITSIDSTGQNIVITDSGQFLQGNVNLGFLMQPGKAPYGNLPLPNGYASSFVITGITQATQAVLTATTDFQAGQLIEIDNVVGMTELNGNSYTVISVTATTVTIGVDSTGFTPYVPGGIASSLQNMVNYQTGEISNLFFPAAVPSGANINVQCQFYQCGLPRSVLFYNNTLTLRCPPALQYVVELDAYLSPAAFFNTAQAIPFGYMAEYIARGAAQKILSDTGDVEQFQFYEPIFREQEMLVWKRSQRQWTSTRVETIYSQGKGFGGSGSYFGGMSGGTL